MRNDGLNKPQNIFQAFFSIRFCQDFAVKKFAFKTQKYYLLLALDTMVTLSMRVTIRYI